MTKTQNLIIMGEAENAEPNAILQIVRWAIDDDMPYAVLDVIGQQMSIMPTISVDWPSLLPKLLRANCFGASGDLTLRRDENTVHWYYVGYQPIGQLSINYQQYADELIIEEDAMPLRALLWGDYNPDRDRWYEPRVGKANLNYPLPQVKTRHQRVMSYAHTVRDSNSYDVVAHWTYNLEPVGYKGAVEDDT